MTVKSHQKYGIVILQNLYSQHGYCNKWRGCSIFLIFHFYAWIQTSSNQIITLNYISITNQLAKKRSSVSSLPRLNWSQICRIGASGWHFNCSTDNCNHNCYFNVSFYSHIYDHGYHDSVVFSSEQQHDNCNDCNEVLVTIVERDASGWPCKCQISCHCYREDESD